MYEKLKSKAKKSNVLLDRQVEKCKNERKQRMEYLQDE